MIETLKPLMREGIINWCETVKSVVEEGEIFVQKARKSSSGLVTILLEGLPNAGKTALAAYLAVRSKFPFIRVCSPANMVLCDVKEKCIRINNHFDDAYKWPLSCLIIDNIEMLIEHNRLAPYYSNDILRTL
ncbi:Vesicle-fusing ATPase 1-like protein [Leptotrombidium deliense]|uniref:Vesicle-fusing ATPase n=1 Tax=Leptotrombidium deliense TaxID=299467 RepID=A0A443RXE8_9ACAR|nr:Vesicle-fusing ATPase 1-like protein [Leptotrombidium deliense]